MNINEIVEHKKDYIVEGVKYTAIANFMSDKLTVKKDNKIIITESLKHYENTDGLNMEGYIHHLIKKYN
jgi:hypothetical protein